MHRFINNEFDKVGSSTDKLGLSNSIVYEIILYLLFANKTRFKRGCTFMILALKAELTKSKYDEQYHDGIMMNSFDDDDDFRSLLSNAISGVDSLRYMPYQRKTGKEHVLVLIKA